MKVLFASSEVYPLVKTGGLADVAYNLPLALANQVDEVRVIMPGYQQALEQAGHLRHVGNIKAFDLEAHILESNIPGSDVKLWFVVEDTLFNRPGNPYLDDSGQEWTDNARRYAFFSAIVAALALGHSHLDWQPDIVHCNDWHTGLVPVYLSCHARPRSVIIPASLFTVHNLAYQGLFPHETFVNLGLNPDLWSYDALEYHGQLSFMKGGLLFSDWINTVSPSYAKEIRTIDAGQGLHTVFQYREDRFSGILNGIDTQIWNPEIDPHIPKPYSTSTIKNKLINKRGLQKELELPWDSDCITLGWVSRFASQKGVEQLMQSLPTLLNQPLQLIMLGSGDPDIESRIQQAQNKYPKQLSVRVGYDEGLAHRIIAGTDFFLMPSEYEPCGLTQMYAQHYGTIPIARATGGLKDTIVNIADDKSKNNGTGILFKNGDIEDLVDAVDRALVLFKNKKAYRQIQLNGMRKDFSWQHSAQKYLAVYQQLIA